MWHEALKKSAGSDRRAAEILFPQWKKKARDEVALARTTPRALANRIGKLQREGDKTRWWLARPQLRQMLADLIGIEQHELFERHRDATDFVTFPEFPALPALRKDESPFRTSRLGSVFDVVVDAMAGGETVRLWGIAPPGAGKTLAVELLRRRFADGVLADTLPTLSSGIARARDAGALSLVIEVEQREPSADEESLGNLMQHPASVIVLAPFGLPDARSRPGARATGVRWRTIDWDPGSTWIDRMIDWVADRIDADPRDSKVDRDEIRGWLQKHPAAARTIETPGELLALCADFDLHGADDPPHKRARRWIAEHGIAALPADAPATWRTRAAARTVLSMVEGNVLNQTHALPGRPSEEWAALVPAETRPATADGVLGAPMVVEYLRAGGLLRGGADGIVPYPRWVSQGIAEGRLRRTITGEPAAVWGALAGDESRRALIDDCLDSLSDGELWTVAERVLPAARAGDAAMTYSVLAAFESTTAAIGRRLASGGGRQDELAAKLLALQLEHLASGSGLGEVPVPVSRRDVDELYLTGWAISLNARQPKRSVRSDAAWLAPGWARDLKLSDIPKLGFPSSSIQPWGASRAVVKLARLAPLVLDRLRPQAVPADVPRLMLPALFLSTHLVECEHLSALSGSWEERYLAAAASRLPVEARHSLAVRLWDLLGSVDGKGAATVAERLELLASQHCPLLGAVLDTIPADIVAATARTAGIHRRYSASGGWHESDPATLRLLGEDARTAAVRGWLERREPQPVRFDEARALVAVLDGQDLELLLDVVRVADREVSAEFAVRVWSVLPERAMEESRRAYSAGLASAEEWFVLAPRERLGALAEIARSAATRPEWVSSWALRRVVDAGAQADKLFDLRRPTAKAMRRRPGRK